MQFSVQSVGSTGTLRASEQAAKFPRGIFAVGKRLSGGRRAARTQRLQPLNAQSAMGEELWALDFDGVICDSCGESSLSAWKAATKLWPDFMSSQDVLDKREVVLQDMRTVRPVVETGYENIVQIRCLLEGVTADAMLKDWPEILRQSMERMDLSRSELVELFGSTRDEWMARDLDSWLAPNRIYGGLPAALKSAIANDSKEVYIVTTKQARFTATLLRDMAGIEFPMERIFSQTVSGQPKTEVLKKLQTEHPDMKPIFVEDKITTLEKVCKVDELSGWELFLADWGYNTDEERTRAHDNPKISVFGLEDFQAMLDGQVAVV